MENNNNQQYITREVFDANILAIREAIAASEARCEGIIKNIKIETVKTQGKIESLQSQLNEIKREQERTQERIHDNTRSILSSCGYIVASIFIGCTFLILVLARALSN